MKATLDIVMFYVRDIKILRDFYVKNFNLEIIEEDDTWILLNAGTLNLAFHRMGEKYMGNIDRKHTFETNVKIIFEIDIDIETAREEFRNRNVQMREIKTFDNYDFWLCDGVDPEGNIFQLKSRKLDKSIL